MCRFNHVYNDKLNFLSLQEMDSVSFASNVFLVK